MASTSPTFRLAREEEDDILGRILYNAFLYNWDINWWQNLRAPIRAVPTSTSTQQSNDLSSTETARLDFFRAVVTMTRLVGGVVALAEPNPESGPAAMLCWFPPHIELTTRALPQSGFLWALLRFGPIGIYRFFAFERALSKLFTPVLSPLGYKAISEGAYVQVVATAPEHGGRGLSSQLLEWQIERHREGYPGFPVFLDTANQYSVKVYERLGFRELGRHRVDVDRKSVMERHQDVDFLQAAMICEP